MARPSKFKPEMIEQARKLAECGMIDKQMAQFFEVTEQTFNNWKKDHPEFFEALKQAKGYVDAMVEDALLQKACGFERDGKYYPPDTTAQIFWLKNRKSQEWRDVKERVHEHRNEDGETNMVELARRIAYLFQEGLDASNTQH